MRALPKITFFAVFILAPASYGHELPPIPKNARLGVASVSLDYAIVCDLQFNRPEMVSDAKALFLKFAKTEFKDPEAATERTFAYMQSHVIKDRLAESRRQTPESCGKISRMLRRELSR